MIQLILVLVMLSMLGFLTYKAFFSKKEITLPPNPIPDNDNQPGPPPPPTDGTIESGQFGSDNSVDNVCQALNFSPETLYWKGVLGIDTILYNDSSLVHPHVGWDYVSYNDLGLVKYFKVDNSTGKVIESGISC